jgi:hypothetical protein
MNLLLPQRHSRFESLDLSAIDLRRLRLVHLLEVTFPATLADAEIVLVKQ